jgi:hypothetical protein
LRYLKFLSAPRSLEIVGYVAVGLSIVSLVQSNLAEVRGTSKFDPPYHLADAALAYVGLVTLLIAGRLSALDKRLKKLEEKTNIDQ